MHVCVRVFLYIKTGNVNERNLNYSYIVIINLFRQFFLFPASSDD